MHSSGLSPDQWLSLVGNPVKMKIPSRHLVPCLAARVLPECGGLMGARGFCSSEHLPGPWGTPHPTRCRPEAHPRDLSFTSLKTVFPNTVTFGVTAVLLLQHKNWGGRRGWPGHNSASPRDFSGFLNLELMLNNSSPIRKADQSPTPVCSPSTGRGTGRRRRQQRVAVVVAQGQA